MIYFLFGALLVFTLTAICYYFFLAATNVIFFVICFISIILLMFYLYVFNHHLKKSKQSYPEFIEFSVFAISMVLILMCFIPYSRFIFDNVVGLPLSEQLFGNDGKIFYKFKKRNFFYYQTSENNISLGTEDEILNGLCAANGDGEFNIEKIIYPTNFKISTPYTIFAGGKKEDIFWGNKLGSEIGPGANKRPKYCKMSANVIIPTFEKEVILAESSLVMPIIYPKPQSGGFYNAKGKKKSKTVKAFFIRLEYKEKLEYLLSLEKKYFESANFICLAIYVIYLSLLVFIWSRLSKSDVKSKI